MTEKLHLPTFVAQLNTRFRVRLDDQRTTELMLTEAADRDSDARFERFSLIFRGPLDPQLEQRIHAFEHAAIGSFELFVTPIGRDERGFSYEAVFNRHVAT